ncbi:MAG: thiamine pyrophosphate-binding protein [Candidatus Micrarchaeota archaeon]|nr:thiamine pyrophosphate-binding protein [Candidatus Micrarchaeota archaeon]
MRKIIEGSIAVAHVVARCGVQVVAAYPITPSTHVPEELSRIQPEYGFEFIPVESEHSALSAIVGASVAGARTFTATASQGLALMNEVLHNASGMRLPLVMVVGNRALSAPLNIWNDWQDGISSRDTGWIQLYCKNNQEVIDTVIQAYKIAETISFPVMVGMDGFYLTHEITTIDLPEKEEISAFLPPFKPKQSLDVEKPLAFGTYMNPQYYMDAKAQQQKDMLAAAKTIEAVAAEFGKAFGRKQAALVEEYQSSDAERVIVTMGSLSENVEIAVDELRAKGERVGLVRIKCFRPFPAEALAKALGGKKAAVMEKDASYGYEGALATELKAALKTDVLGIVCGLGGRDVKLGDVKKVFEMLSRGEKGTVWL